MEKKPEDQNAENQEKANEEAQQKNEAVVAEEDKELVMELHDAIIDLDFEAVTKLLERGADVNVISKYGDSALYTAVCTGHKDMVKLILDAGAKVDKS